MAQEPLQLPHKLTLNQRNNLTLTGVSEVISFDDGAVILRTSLGTLVVQGRDLQLKNLSLEAGQATVDGEISGLIYEEPRNSGGLWHRLFG